MQTSDGARERIAEIAALIRGFLNEAEFDEDTYERSLRLPLEERFAALPADAAARLHAFVREAVEPLVFDTERAFAACRGKGHFEDGAFIVDRSDDYFVAFQSVIGGVERKLQGLENELYALYY